MTKQEELRALALAATPGPWTFRQKWADHIDAEDGDICMLTDNLFTGLTRPLLDRRNNASYIAAMSPDKTLALLDELDAARKALGVALEALKSSQDCIQAMTDGPHHGDWGTQLDTNDAAITMIEGMVWQKC